ncbi:MAG: lytic transglycosylase domain-containing protein [Thermodesulfobacteriota bacterium]
MMEIFRNPCRDHPAIPMMVIILGLIFPAMARADIYKYIDKDGILHFTNVPTTGGYALYLKENSSSVKSSEPPDRYEDYIEQASEKHGLSIPIIKAIIRAESNFNPWAVSNKGARGLMQIMPDNFQSLDLKDPFNPRENILAGTKFFKSLLTRFEGNLRLALAAYNAGAEAVDRHRGIPPYRETEEYVERVLRYYQLYHLK